MRERGRESERTRQNDKYEREKWSGGASEREKESERVFKPRGIRTHKNNLLTLIMERETTKKTRSLRDRIACRIRINNML